MSAGSVAATVLWIAGSVAFSIYVGSFGKYNQTYGSLGAVVVLLLWLYLTAFTILFGAELQLRARAPDRRRHHGRRPSPARHPGAVMADTVAGVTAEQPASARIETTGPDTISSPMTEPPAFVSKENQKLIALTLGAGAVAGAVLTHALEKD